MNVPAFAVFIAHVESGLDNLWSNIKNFIMDLDDDDAVKFSFTCALKLNLENIISSIWKRFPTTTGRWERSVTPCQTGGTERSALRMQKAMTKPWWGTKP